MPQTLESLGKELVMYRLDCFGDQKMIDNGQANYDDVVFFPSGFNYKPVLGRFGFKKGTIWVKKNFYDECGAQFELNPIGNMLERLVTAIIWDLYGEINEGDLNQYFINWSYNIESEDGYSDLFFRTKNNIKLYDYDSLRYYLKSLVYNEKETIKVPHYVYRLFKCIKDFNDGGECYVGITNNIRRRMREHLKSDKEFEWVQYIEVPSKEEALVIEQALIAFNPNSYLENKVRRSDYMLFESTGIHDDMKTYLISKEDIELSREVFNSLSHINEVTMK